MSEAATNIIPSDVSVGDKLRLTYTAYGAEYIVTGTAEEQRGQLLVGKTSIGSITVFPGFKIERLLPEWAKALVIRVAGRTFARIYKNDPRWMEINTPGTQRREFSTTEIGRIGPVTVLVDENNELSDWIVDLMALDRPVVEESNG